MRNKNLPEKEYMQDKLRFIAITLLLLLLIEFITSIPVKAYQANADNNAFTYYSSANVNAFSPSASFTSGQLTLNASNKPLTYTGDRYVWGTLLNDHPFMATAYAPILPPALFFGTGSAFGTAITIKSWNTVTGGIITKNSTTIPLYLPLTTTGRLYDKNSTIFQYKSGSQFKIGFISNATLSNVAYGQISDGIYTGMAFTPARYAIYGPTNSTQFFITNIITFDIQTTEGVSVANIAKIEFDAPYVYTGANQPQPQAFYIQQKMTYNTIFDTWDKDAYLFYRPLDPTYTFVEWKVSGAIFVDNPYNPITRVKIDGDGTITLVVTKTTGQVTIFAYDNKTRQGVKGVIVDLYNSQGTVPITTAITNPQGFAYLNIGKNLYKIVTRTPEASDKYPTYGLNATWRYRFDHYEANQYLYDPMWGPKYNNPVGNYNDSVVMLNATSSQVTINIAMVKQYRVAISGTLTQSTETQDIFSPTLSNVWGVRGIGETYPSGIVWVDEGKQLPIKAIPKPGYEFYKWIAILENNRTNDQLPTIQNPRAPTTTITVTNPIQLIAIFRPATRLVPVYVYVKDDSGIPLRGIYITIGSSSFQTDSIIGLLNTQYYIYAAPVITTYAPTKMYGTPLDYIRPNDQATYIFDHWETTGTITISNPNSYSTFATINDGGSIIAVYRYNIRLTVKVIDAYTWRPVRGARVVLDVNTSNALGFITNNNGEVTFTVLPYPSHTIYLNEQTLVDQGIKYTFYYWYIEGYISYNNPTSVPVRYYDMYIYAYVRLKYAVTIGAYPPETAKGISTSYATDKINLLDYGTPITVYANNIKNLYGSNDNETFDHWEVTYFYGSFSYKAYYFWNPLTVYAYTPMSIVAVYTTTIKYNNKIYTNPYITYTATIQQNGLGTAPGIQPLTVKLYQDTFTGSYYQVGKTSTYLQLSGVSFTGMNTTLVTAYSGKYDTYYFVTVPPEPDNYPVNYYISDGDYIQGITFDKLRTTHSSTTLTGDRWVILTIDTYPMKFKQGYGVTRYWVVNNITTRPTNTYVEDTIYVSTYQSSLPITTKWASGRSFTFSLKVPYTFKIFTTNMPVYQYEPYNGYVLSSVNINGQNYYSNNFDFTFTTSAFVRIIYTAYRMKFILNASGYPAYSTEPGNILFFARDVQTVANTFPSSMYIPYPVPVIGPSTTFPGYYGYTIPILALNETADFSQQYQTYYITRYFTYNAFNSWKIFTPYVNFYYNFIGQYYYANWTLPLIISLTQRPTYYSSINIQINMKPFTTAFFTHQYNPTNKINTVNILIYAYTPKQKPLSLINNNYITTINTIYNNQIIYSKNMPTNSQYTITGYTNYFIENRFYSYGYPSVAKYDYRISFSITYYYIAKGNLYSQPYPTYLQQQIHNRTLENLYNYNPKTIKTQPTPGGNTITSDNFDSYPNQSFYPLTSKYFYNYFTYTSGYFLINSGPFQESPTSSPPNALYMYAKAKNPDTRDTRLAVEWRITNVPPGSYFNISFNVYIKSIYDDGYASRLGIVIAFIDASNGRLLGAAGYILAYGLVNYYPWLPSDYWKHLPFKVSDTWSETSSSNTKVTTIPLQTLTTVTIDIRQAEKDAHISTQYIWSDIIIAFSSRPADGPNAGNTGWTEWWIDDFQVYTGSGAGGGGSSITVKSIGNLVPLNVYGWDLASAKVTIPYNYYQAYYGLFVIEDGWITISLSPTVEVPAQAWYGSSVKFVYSEYFGYWSKWS